MGQPGLEDCTAIADLPNHKSQDDVLQDRGPEVEGEPPAGPSQHEGGGKGLVGVGGGGEVVVELHPEGVAAGGGATVHLDGGGRGSAAAAVERGPEFGDLVHVEPVDVVGQCHVSRDDGPAAVDQFGRESARAPLADCAIGDGPHLLGVEPRLLNGVLVGFQFVPTHQPARPVA